MSSGEFGHCKSAVTIVEVIIIAAEFAGSHIVRPVIPVGIKPNGRERSGTQADRSGGFSDIFEFEISQISPESVFGRSLGICLTVDPAVSRLFDNDANFHDVE